MNPSYFSWRTHQESWRTEESKMSVWSRKKVYPLSFVQPFLAACVLRSMNTSHINSPLFLDGFSPIKYLLGLRCRRSPLASGCRLKAQQLQPEPDAGATARGAQWRPTQWGDFSWWCHGEIVLSTVESFVDNDGSWTKYPKSDVPLINPLFSRSARLVLSIW